VTGGAADRALRPPVPRLMAISDRRALAPRPFDEWLEALAAAGVDAVQVREKDLADRALYDLVRRARERLPGGCTVLVNGRLDVAIAAGADGIHLPAAGLPVPALRRWADGLGRSVLIGRSTHTAAEVRAARDEGADYVTFGPVYPTPSKAAYGPPPGLEGLRRVTGLGIPVVALGGVDEENLPAVAAAGAVGAAGIRVFLAPGPLGRLARRARSHFSASS